jgi:hypothetical protein
VIKNSKNIFQNIVYSSQFKFILFFLYALYVWQQSHFQFQEYWGEPYRSLTYYFLTSVILIGAIFALFDKYSYNSICFTGSYIFLILFYGFLQYVLYHENILIYLKSIVILIAALLIIKSKENLYIYIKINFILGMVLVFLNTAALFHWLNIIELPYEQISRIGGTQDRPDLDPYSFGIFGRTESYIGSGNIAPRLQGFSSEPLHWAYFVLMTFSMGMILFAQTNNQKLKFIFLFCFAVVLFHAYFLKSTTMFISLIYIAVCFIFILLLYRINLLKKYKKISAFIALIIIPGFIIPFSLALVSNAVYFFHAESIFSEKRNWEGKIDFLYLGGKLFTQALPSIGSYVPITHNFILDMYIKFGYLLLLPLIMFLFEFINITINENKYFNLSVVIFLVTATMASPFMLFSPSGVLWAAVIFGAAYHSKLIGSKA